MCLARAAQNNNGTYSVVFTSNVVGDTRVILRFEANEMPPYSVSWVEKPAGGTKARGVEAPTSDPEDEDAHVIE